MADEVTEQMVGDNASLLEKMKWVEGRERSNIRQVTLDLGEAIRGINIALWQSSQPGINGSPRDGLERAHQMLSWAKEDIECEFNRRFKSLLRGDD